MTSNDRPVRESDKIRQDLVFYYLTGWPIYLVMVALNVIHLYQSKGMAWTDLLFHLFYAITHLALVREVRRYRDWARKVFVFKFVVFAIFFYPKILLAGAGGWVYSSHWPHGVLQRIANMSAVLYEFLFALYLRRKVVRMAFRLEAQSARNRPEDGRAELQNNNEG